MTKIPKEPLVHFIIAGIVLFLIYGFFGNKTDKVKGNTIQVSKGQIDLMHAHWTRQLGRPPTESELQGLIDDHIREEILMQEALAMGLDNDDIIIRRRLAQKMEFVSGDILTVEEPTEAEIQTYYENHKEEFFIQDKVSLLQIYFSVNKRSEEQSIALAKKVKSKLEPLNIEDIDFTKYGDQTMLRTDFINLTEDQLKSEFGDTEIIKKVAESETNTWQDPVSSNFGLHLIYVLEHEPGYIPALDEVSEKIKNKKIDERKEILDRQFMAELRSRYTVEISDEVIDTYNYKNDDTL